MTYHDYSHRIHQEQRAGFDRSYLYLAGSVLLIALIGLGLASTVGEIYSEVPQSGAESVENWHGNAAGTVPLREWP